MYYTYVLQSKSGSYYIGFTKDLRQRVKQHEKERPGYRLVYYEAYADVALAHKRERLLKHYGSAWRALRGRITVKRAG